MNRNIYLLLALLVFTGCHPAIGEDPIGDNTTDAAPEETDALVGSADDQILANYEAEVALYQNEAGMLPEWEYWMLERKDWLSKAYISGRTGHNVNVYVRYDSQIPYNPPWTSEDEHFAALKYLAELQYPGWSFTFLTYYDGVEAEMDGHDVVAVLGYQGDYSNASGHTIYLVYETIFGHEFGHTLGLHHHYCGSGNDPGDYGCPDNHPPGEGPCIMDRNSVSFGPTENTFLLLTTGERQESKILEAMANIHNRYPANWFASKPDRNDCGMD